MKRDSDEEVNRAIELANTCQALRALPRAGGVLDQDSYQIYMIQCVLAAQAERNELDQKKAQQRSARR